MSVPAVIWHGVKSATLRNRREHQSSDTIFEVTIVYEGQFDLLRKAAPAIGDGVNGYENIFVEDITFESSGQADKGILTVCASDRLTKTVDEVEWLRLDQDIRNHKIFQTDGTWVLTDNDRRTIEAKLNAPNDTTVPSPTGNAVQLYQRMLKGETSFAAYIPVARRESYFLSFPETIPCGHTDTPPMPVPSGYTYVSTADRATRSGFYWKRTKEWTGFKQIDTAIVNAT